MKLQLSAIEFFLNRNWFWFMRYSVISATADMT